jgi:hypothetical protein
VWNELSGRSAQVREAATVAQPIVTPPKPSRLARKRSSPVVSTTKISSRGCTQLTEGA